MEIFRTDFIEFRHLCFGKTPERFNPIYMTFPSSKFVFGMVNLVVDLPIQNQFIISLPAVGIKRRLP